MRPLFHFADLWKCFVKLFKNVDRVQTEDGSTLLVEDNVAIDGNLAVTGEVTAGAESEWQVFENIVDKDGHKRFIEGDITIKTMTGVTQSYGKWSLSGTHLMIVVAGTIENGTSIPYTGDFAKVELPQWIKDKVFTLVENGNMISYLRFQLVDADNTVQEQYAQLRKITVGGESDVWITISSITLNSTKGFRYQFDLLIDNE